MGSLEEHESFGEPEPSLRPIDRQPNRPYEITRVNENTVLINTTAARHRAVLPAIARLSCFTLHYCVKLEYNCQGDG